MMNKNNNQAGNTQRLVKVYRTRSCPYCVKAVDLLEDKGVVFEEIDVSRNPYLRMEMEGKANRRTVPQIFVGEIHLGGCEDIYRMERAGELDDLLGLQSR